jgi:hypothetical protein
LAVFGGVDLNSKNSTEAFSGRITPIAISRPLKNVAWAYTFKGLIRRGNCPFHFGGPIFNFINRDAHAGVLIPHPFRMSIVGPYWLERLRFGEV